MQNDPAEYRKQAKALSEIEPIVERFREYKSVAAEHRADRGAGGRRRPRHAGARRRRSCKSLVARRDALVAELKVLLVPKDPNDEKNVVLEIRAGTGGDEAALFAAELFRMYSKYAERQGWRIEVMSSNDTGVGGLKEVIATIEGRGVYSKLKYESGVHRVQRVPATEASGRIHTSTVTVAVLPEAEEVDVQINEKDLRIDTFCSSGPGGQSVNTTYSAVRLTHIPTGVVVSQQDEKSQIKNRAKAMKVLRSRLYEMELRKQQEAIAKDRRSQVGTGERSEKIRTYNFRENRITDHRVNFTTHRLTEVLNGDLAELARQRHHALPVREAQGRDGCVNIAARARWRTPAQRLRAAGIDPAEADLDARAAGAARPRLGCRPASGRRTRCRRPPDSRPPTSSSSDVAPRASRSPTSPASRSSGADVRRLAGRAHPPARDRAHGGSRARALPRPGRAPGRGRRRNRQRLPRRRAGRRAPGADRQATDVSADALAVARRNARRHGVAGRVRLVEGRSPRRPPRIVRPHRRRTRPYVPDGLAPRSSPRSATTSRPMALFAGADGLDVVRRLVADAGGRLHPGGALIFEIRVRPGGAVADLLSSAPLLRFVAIEPDLQGIPRTAVALRA